MLKTLYISFGSVEVCFQTKFISKLLPFIYLPQRLSDAVSQLCPICSCRHTLSVVNNTLVIHLMIMGQAAIVPLLWLTGTHKVFDKTLLSSVKHKFAVNLCNRHKGGLSQLR